MLMHFVDSLQTTITAWLQVPTHSVTAINAKLDVSKNLTMDSYELSMTLCVVGKSSM